MNRSTKTIHLSALFCIFILHDTTYAQTGINIKKPLQTFHVDGKNDNNTTTIPSAIQQKNDFVVTENGDVGIGTIYPSTKLEVNGDVRITDVPVLAAMPKKILVLDKEGNLFYTDVENIAPPLASRIYGVINKIARQFLPVRGVYYNVTLDGLVEGVNADKLTINAGKDKLFLPPNKTLKLSGSIGLIGSTINPSVDAPAYIISEFELDNFNNDGSKQLVKTIGYTESSTERYDDGGVSVPIIIIRTGNKGANVQLKVKYLGVNSPTNGYYIGGAAGEDTLASYILIEEI